MSKLETKFVKCFLSQDDSRNYKKIQKFLENKLDGAKLKDLFVVKALINSYIKNNSEEMNLDEQN